MKTFMKLRTVWSLVHPPMMTTPQDLRGSVFGSKSFLPRRSQRPEVPGLSFAPANWTSGFGRTRAAVFGGVSSERFRIGRLTYVGHVGINLEAKVLEITIFVPFQHTNAMSD
jgi:hypothetical protein